MTCDRRFSVALLTTAALHGCAILGLGLWRRDNAPATIPASKSVEVALITELLRLSDDARPPVPRDVIAPHHASARLPAVTSTSTRERDVIAPHQPNPTSGESYAWNNNEATSEATGLSANTTDTDFTAAEFGANGAAPVDESTGPKTRKGSNETLGERVPFSREQLGLGVGQYAVVLPKESPISASKEARLVLSQRLNQSIRQDALERAGDLGLGEEGPILRKLEQLSLANLTDVSGFAIVRARLLDSGKLVFELEGSSNDRAAWNRLLERAKQELEPLSLKPPRGARALEVVIRMESRIQMPSGADPGFGVKMFGIPFKKGEGKRSSRLEILSSLPHFELDESAVTKGEKGINQRLVIEVGKLALDPADLSAKRSRVTSARVVSRKLL